LLLPLHQALSALVIFLLIAFTLRRLVMITAAALPSRPRTAAFEPSVAVIVAAKNEAESLPQLLKALNGIEYSPEKLRFVLVNDGSRDATGEILESWAASRPNARYVESANSVGKAQALNLALRVAPETDLVAVYDADLTPHAGSLRILAAAFLDPRVAAATGYRRPSNAGGSPVAAYAALESFVHQLITQAGKDRLGLNPTTLGGNCAYRRAALHELGGFRAGALREDIEISLALVEAGWRTRFCPEAVADCPVVESFGRYWNQRSRWTRGIYRASARARHLESWLVSAGYLDRLVFLAALALAAAGHLGYAWPALYLSAPAAAAGCALWRANLGVKVTAYVLFWTLPMFAVDVAVTVTATVSALLGRRQKWLTGAPRA
jgi:Glycosyltransferases, probably involved in cell wall biogenesis